MKRRSFLRMLGLAPVAAAVPPVAAALPKSGEPMVFGEFDGVKGIPLYDPRGDECIEWINVSPDGNLCMKIARIREEVADNAVGAIRKYEGAIERATLPSLDPSA